LKIAVNEQVYQDVNMKKGSVKAGEVENR